MKSPRGGKIRFARWPDAGDQKPVINACRQLAGLSYYATNRQMGDLTAQLREHLTESRIL
jgi:hypothetical protein